MDKSSIGEFPMRISVKELNELECCSDFKVLPNSYIRKCGENEGSGLFSVLSTILKVNPSVIKADFYVCEPGSKSHFNDLINGIGVGKNKYIVYRYFSSYAFASTKKSRSYALGP